jgi:hypothetical protein
MNYWYEGLKNKSRDVFKQEKINFESGMQFWQLDSDKRKYNARFLEEPEVYKDFCKTSDIPDFRNMCGYLFLDDILQDAIWNDEKNFNHKTLIVAFTRLYQTLRDDTKDLIVIASTNHKPLSGVMDNDTRIQSRIIGLFENRIEIK